MTDRHPTEQRRAEIAEATLRLLADTPLEALTTRAVARELGVSQPSLFRHFRSREQLLLAAVERARSDMLQEVERVLGSTPSPMARARGLGEALLAYVARYPGLPRLLFGSVAPAPGPVRAELARVVTTQAALVAELLRAGQRAGELDAAVDAEQAATLFVGLVQGLVLRWELDGRVGAPGASFGAAFELFRRAIGAQQEVARATPEAPRVPDAVAARALGVLDVRPVLARRGEPLPAILDAIGALRDGGVLAIHAPFHPKPLVSLLAARGHGVAVERADDALFVVLVTMGGGAPPDDLRDLEPPEPLERVLVESARLRQAGLYVARLPRVPRLLLPRLRERGHAFAVEELADGTALLGVEGPT